MLALLSSNEPIGDPFLASWATEVAKDETSTLVRKSEEILKKEMPKGEPALASASSSTLAPAPAPAPAQRRSGRSKAAAVAAVKATVAPRKTAAAMPRAKLPPAPRKQLDALLQAVADKDAKFEDRVLAASQVRCARLPLPSAPAH